MGLLDFKISDIGEGIKAIRTAITGEEIKDPNKIAELDYKLQVLQNSWMEYDAKVKEFQASTIIAEAKGEGFLQKNWRPITMLSFVAIIINNYILFPYLQMMFGTGVRLEIPPDMWELLKIGIGGYVVGRSVEKGIKTWRAGQ